MFLVLSIVTALLCGSPWKLKPVVANTELAAPLTALRFGFFAMLPLPDVDATLREIEYALDTLKADGVGVLTSYGSKWLGDTAFAPVFDELNRRNAVIHVHPMVAPRCQNLLPNTGPATIEWNTDTSRAIWSFINDGAPNAPIVSGATRNANIKFIWSHAGGSLLGLIGRFLVAGSRRETLVDTAVPNSRLHHLRRF